MQRDFNHFSYLIISLIILASFVAVTPVTNHQPVQADNNKPKLFFQDDYSDSKSGWPAFDSDVGSSAYHNGAYEIAIKKTEYLYRVSNSKMPVASQFMIEVDISMLAGQEQDYTGIIVKWNDKDSLESAGFECPPDYFFNICPADGTATLYNKKSDIGNSNSYRQFFPGVLLPNKPYSCINQNNQTNHINLAIQDNRIIASVNNVNLVDAKDDSIAYAQKLVNEGLISGATVSITSGKYKGLSTAVFSFDNLKYYYNGDAAVIAPSLLKGSSTLADTTMMLRNKGFDIKETTYYDSTGKDLANKLKTSCAAYLAQITVLCDASENMAVRSMVPKDYTGEVNIVNVNFLDFAASAPELNKTSYKPGDNVLLKTVISNTGLVDITNGIIKYAMNDTNGSSIYMNEMKLDAIPLNGKKDLEIEVPVSMFTANGQYRIDVVINANAVAGGTKLTTENKIGTPIQVSGQSPVLIIVIIVGILVIGGGITGFIINSKKRKKPEKTASQ